MPRTSFNVLRLARAEGGLPRRSNSSQVSGLRERLSEQTLAFSETRRNFASAAMETALAAAFKHAFNTRKQEDGLTLAEVGRRCGRWKQHIWRTLQGEDWRLSTLSDFTEALDLRLEFAFVDRKHPHRRFTSNGIACAQIDRSEAILGG
jgi:hypothetical protein